MSMTTHEAIERAEGELLGCVHHAHDPTILALAYAALAIAKALAEVNEQAEAVREASRER